MTAARACPDAAVQGSYRAQQFRRVEPFEAMDQLLQFRGSGQADIVIESAASCAVGTSARVTLDARGYGEGRTEECRKYSAFVDRDR